MIWVKEVPGNPPNRCKIGRVSQKCLPMIVTSRGFTEGHDNTPCTLVSIRKQDTRYGGFISHTENQPRDTRGDCRHHAGACGTFMNKFRELGFISYNGHLEVHNSLLNVVLHDKPQIRRGDTVK